MIEARLAGDVEAAGALIVPVVRKAVPVWAAEAGPLVAVAADEVAAAAANVSLRIPYGGAPLSSTPDC